MIEAINIVESNDLISKLFEKNACYGRPYKCTGNSTIAGPDHTLPVARAVFNQSYFYLHPFVFENLPIFFLNSFSEK